MQDQVGIKKLAQAPQGQPDPTGGFIIHPASQAPRSGAVIVYGGPITGKTYHSRAIAQALGCSSVHDGCRDDLIEKNGFALPLVPGGLYLVPERPKLNTRHPEDVLIVSVETALAVAIMRGLI